MKKCSEIKELISLYIDDELNVDERREFEEHTASCRECRNELDELAGIVELCRNATEEELPANFKTELHQKLLEVREQSEKSRKPVFYQTTYFKLVSSVAAVFLLVFLIRGIYNFDLLPNGKFTLSNESNKSAAENAADNQLQMKSAMPEAAAAPNSDGRSGAALGDTYKSDAEAPVSGTEIDRSTTEGRETKAGMAVVAAGESVSRNTTSVIVSVDDPDSQVENIRNTAAKSSGVEQPDDVPLGTETAALADKNGVVLLLNMPSIQLDSFIEALNTDYGKSNVQPEALITEDMSVTMEELLKQSDSLDLEIDKLENSDEADAGELDKLRVQKTEIQNKIDALRLASDLTNVKVILKKK